MSEAVSAPAAGFQQNVPLGGLIVVQVICELVFLYGGHAWMGWGAKALTALLPLFAWRSLAWREAYLLGVCALLILLVWAFERPLGPVLVEGLDRAAYLTSFILLMALLREGAVKSSAVLRVGTYLTRQPPGRRFFTIFSGTHLFAVLINLGALSLFAPIIQRGTRHGLPPGAPLDDISQVRERRQLSAALRGFSWFLLWAPTSVTQAVMPTLLSGIDAARLMGTGFALASVMFAVSWLEDRLRWRGLRKRLQAEGRLPRPVAGPFPRLSALHLAAVCGVLFGLTLAFSRLGQVTVVTGVMLSAPIVVGLWILVQQGRAGGQGRIKATMARLREIAFGSMPGYGREAIFLACAGFIGTLTASLVLAAEAAALLHLADWPAWLVLWVLSVSVWVFGQVGLSPITMAVFLGSVVADLPNLPVDMTLAALAIAAGTGLCTLGAPFSSGAIMLARASGYSASTLTWRWNGLHSLVVMAVLAVVYVVLTWI